MIAFARDGHVAEHRISVDAGVSVERRAGVRAGDAALLTLRMRVRVAFPLTLVRRARLGAGVA